MKPQRVKKDSRREPRAERSSANHDVSHLIISDQDTDVRGICESAISYGWDIVSTNQSLFCDMEHKQLYPLCNPTIDTKCFDVNFKTLVGAPSLDIRDDTV